MGIRQKTDLVVEDRQFLQKLAIVKNTTPDRNGNASQHVYKSWIRVDYIPLIILLIFPSPDEVWPKFITIT